MQRFFFSYWVILCTVFCLTACGKKMKSGSPAASAENSAENLESPAPNEGGRSGSPEASDPASGNPPLVSSNAEDDKGDGNVSSLSFGDGVWAVKSIKCGGNKIWSYSGKTKDLYRYKLTVTDMRKNFHFEGINSRGNEKEVKATCSEEKVHQGLITSFSLKPNSSNNLESIEYTVSYGESGVVKLRSDRLDTIFCPLDNQSLSEVQLTKS